MNYVDANSYSPIKIRKYSIETHNENIMGLQNTKIFAYDQEMFYCNQMYNFFPTTVKVRGIFYFGPFLVRNRT